MLRKSHLAVTIVMSMLFVFSGCQSDKKDIEAKELLKAATANLQSADSFEVQKNIEIDIETVDQDQLLTAVVCNMKTQKKPSDLTQLEISSNITVSGEMQEFDMQQYFEGQDGGYTIYTRMDDKWEKETDADQKKIKGMIENPLGNIINSLEEEKDAVYAGKKKIDDVSCYAFKVKIRNRNVASMIEQTDVLESMGVDEDELNKEMQQIEDEVSGQLMVYINKDTKEIVSQSIDLSDIMKKIMLDMEGMPEEQLKDFVFKIDEHYSNINNVEEIILPSEARSAVEEKK